MTPSDADRVLDRHVMQVESPAARGPHEVLTLYYGSGADKNRPEYRDSVAVRTASVDASKLVDLGSSAKSRNRYWGFSPDSFPINGRVWYPEARGPHPLVLVVHGNHNMKDFSDPGYDWLGELLASRGYILASIDMNFVNGGIRGENDARGWLLLKHLQEWERFAEDPENPFFGRVDMENIALIGHSRGGEAVGHAAAFNRLSRYPDDARLLFDFDFDIRAIIAIAPVDGQYLPANQRVPVRDVNYLVFHGSHDGDVTSFHGLRQYNRVDFAEGSDFFKSAVYVYRANHGQWNTVWGAYDHGPRSARTLNLDALLPAEDQREFGRVYISAFLDIVLKGKDGYRPLFRDHRVAGGWLPPTMYSTRFEHSSFRPLASFEEDIDVTTGTATGARILGEGLGVWREGRLDLRSSNRSNTSSSQLNQALWLGWNNEYEDGEAAPPASLSLTLPEDTAQSGTVDAGMSLEFHAAALEDVPARRPRPDAQADSLDRNEREPAETDKDDSGSPREPLSFSIEVEDAAGERAGLPPEAYGELRYPLKIQVLRRRDLEEDRFRTPWELILQHFSIPLGDFAHRNPRLDLGALRRIRFVFDKSPRGTVVLDDVGLARLPESFLSARLPPP